MCCTVRCMYKLLSGQPQETRTTMWVRDASKRTTEDLFTHTSHIAHGEQKQSMEFVYFLFYFFVAGCVVGFVVLSGPASISYRRFFLFARHQKDMRPDMTD